VTIVVDASVALKWLLPEPDSAMAERVAAADHHLIAPTLVIAESCNAVWKRLRRGEVAADHAQLVVARLPTFFDSLVGDAGLAPMAMTIARALDHPVYDCFYLALAEKEAAALVTADRCLAERVRATPWEDRVVALDAWGATI
jgi:predicted nucleic acid-binding protein